MDFFRHINITPRNSKNSSPLPNPLRKISNSRFISCQTPEMSPSPTSQLAKKKTYIQLVNNDLDKIEEELDIKLSELNQKYHEENSLEKLTEKQIKLYEKYIDKMIISIKFIDSKASRVLSRIMLDYSGSIRKVIKKAHSKKNESISKAKEIGIQVNLIEAPSEDTEEEYEKYINLLNKALYKIGNMNHDKIINKLEKSLKSLSPVDVPIMQDLDIETSVQKKIEKLLSPIPVSLSHGEKIYISRNRSGYVQATRGEQTDPDTYVEHLKSVIADRELEIAKLSEEIASLKTVVSELDKTEIALAASEKALRLLRNSECKRCLDRQKEIRVLNEELKKNKKTIEKLQEELQSARAKLKEVAYLLEQQNEKNYKLAESVIELNEKIAELENIRSFLEEQLKQFEGNSMDQSIDDSQMCTSENLTPISLDFKVSFSKKNPNRNSEILKILKISKSEFLRYSKKSRFELFELLYEHKDKCGPECEHLKRAMKIKQKEKGTVFYLKKYNIVKD